LDQERLAAIWGSPSLDAVPAFLATPVVARNAPPEEGVPELPAPEDGVLAPPGPRSVPGKGLPFLARSRYQERASPEEDTPPFQRSWLFSRSLLQKNTRDKISYKSPVRTKRPVCREMPVLPGTLERPEHLPPTTTPHTYLADNADIASMLGALTPIMLIGLDIETTGPDPHRGRLRLLTLATPDRAYVIDCLKIPGVADLVAHLFRDPARTFVAHHAALAQGFLLAAGILPVDGVGPESGWWDTMIASQFLDGGPNLHTPSHHTLEGVATRLGMGARDAALLLPLYHKQRTLVEQAGLGQVAAIEMAAMPAMALMSFAGMPIDAGRWRALARDAQAAKVAAAAKGTA